MPGVEKTMHEFKTGELRSGSGAKVTSREQAIAIALSEEREAKKKKRKATDGEVVMSRWNGRDERDKEFSTELRKELAKSGKAMKGGGFPIENEADLKNAIQAFGRACNKAAAKAHIKKRAAALGKTELLPENWDSADPLWVGNDALCHSIYDAWMETDDQEAIRKYGRIGTPAASPTTTMTTRTTRKGMMTKTITMTLPPTSKCGMRSSSMPSEKPKTAT